MTALLSVPVRRKRIQLKVSKESKSGLNTEFINVETGRYIPLEQAVTQINTEIETTKIIR